jgi:uncharacterized protein
MNRLQHETSPYLLQHADNPVDWYAWGQDAFAAAKTQNKPILLSIGYSACHWCHVMAHESFEDDATAAIMNDLFINIKVDREERPDVDDIYMQATLAFTRGHGGWPMTVFLTPDGRPFHAGTYFPPEPRYMNGRLAMPSFKQVMRAVDDFYRNRPDELEDMANSVAQALREGGGLPGTGDEVTELNQQILDTAARKFVARVDMVHGGLHRGQPKFPSPMNLEFLLRHYTTSKDEAVLQPVRFTLQKMAAGGIYDQLGGGFHRYSVDHEWLVPHFEKMLYDNAQLARLYLHAYQVTGDAHFKTIMTDIFDYIEREMLDDSGGFYSTQDADSEGEEGKFFVWTPEEIQGVLGETFSPAEIAAYMAAMDITPHGNFEGNSIPNRRRDIAEKAEDHHMTVDELEALIARVRPVLFEHREQRIKPARDEKMITAWNGMMLAAFAEAAFVLDNLHYREIAVRNAEFILTKLSREDGRLYRTHKRNDAEGESKIDGFLEDYANAIDGLLQLYQTTADVRWFTEAQRLADLVLAHFYTEGKLYDTSDLHEELVARPRTVQDNATPAGNNLMALNLLRLHGYTGAQRYEDVAVEILSAVSAAMEQYPSAFGVALQALHMLTHRLQEIVILRLDGDFAEFTAPLRESYRPLSILAAAQEDQPAEATPPVLAHRVMQDGQPTVYVCERFVCQRPVTTVEDFAALLK